jgi:hypothetical protein
LSPGLNSYQALYTQDIFATTNSGGGTASSDQLSYTNGQTVTLTATPAYCYSFQSWISNGVPILGSNILTFIANTPGTNTFTANFVLSTYTISNSVFPAGAGSVSPPFSAACGSQITLTATNGPCYQFQNWTVGGSAVSTSTNYSFTLSNNVSPIANFVAAQEVLAQASPANGGMVTGSGTYVAGSSVTLTSTPASAWRFLGWSDGLPAVFNPRTIRLGANPCGVTNVVAEFQPGSALVQLGAPGWATNGLNLVLNAPTGNYQVQVSTDLLHWLTLTSFTSTNSPAQLTDPGAAGYRQRFYRAVWVP